MRTDCQFSAICPFFAVFCCKVGKFYSRGQKTGGKKKQKLSFRIIFFQIKHEKGQFFVYFIYKNAIKNEYKINKV